MRWRQLSPAQRTQIAQVLQDAFPTPGVLEELALYALGSPLSQITGGGPLSKIVHLGQKSGLLFALFGVYVHRSGHYN